MGQVVDPLRRLMPQTMATRPPPTAFIGSLTAQSRQRKLEVLGGGYPLYGNGLGRLERLGKADHSGGQADNQKERAPAKGCEEEASEPKGEFEESYGW